MTLNYPKSIYEDEDSTLWVGEINSIVRVDKTGYKRYSLGADYNSISYHDSFSFAEDAFGHIWVAPYKGTLLSYDERSDEFVPVALKEKLTEVRAIASVRGDHLLIGGKEGIIQLKIDSKKDVLESHYFDAPLDLADIQVVDDTYVFIASWKEGMYTFNQNLGFESLEKLEGVGIADIVNLDYNKNTQELWIAGNESIGVLKHTQVNTLGRIGDNRIESLKFDNQGGYYYSTGEQVSYIDDINHGSPRSIIYSSETFFTKIFKEENALWFGDFFGSIFYMDSNSTKPTYINQKAGSAVNYIFKDDEGNKWFAGGINGLIKVDAEKNHKSYENITSSTAIKQSESGVLVCSTTGTQDFLYIYEDQNDSFESLKLDYEFDNSEVINSNDLAFDEDENIWVASNVGLLLVEKKENGYETVDRVEVSGFDEADFIRSIAISGKDIWLAYAEGLVLYKNGETLLFNKDSGLPSNILIDRGLQYGPDEKLYIHTAKGVATIEGDAIDFLKSKAPIIKSLVVNSNVVNLENEYDFVFPYNSRLEGKFLSLDFPNTSVQYQSRVIGYDDQWSDPSTNTNVSILGFSAGDYTLQIRAKRGGRLWSDPLSFSFSVSKPWYREWWAIVFFVVSGTLVVILFVQIQSRNLIRQKRKLQRTIEERTEEIQTQKNEIIAQQERIIKQKEELLAKTNLIHESDQARDKAELNFLHLKEKQLQEQIEYKNKQITTHALNILQKNESLKELREEIKALLVKPEKSMIAELKKTLKVIDGSFKLDKDWEDFKLYFEQIYTGFYAKLKINFPDITNHEMRHCALIRLNLSISECASILGISHDSVKVSRSRLRKKLGLAQSQGLTEFIMSL